MTYKTFHGVDSISPAYRAAEAELQERGFQLFGATRDHNGARSVWYSPAANTFSHLEDVKEGV